MRVYVSALLLLAVCLLLCASSCDGKTMWGSRKKRDSESDKKSSSSSSAAATRRSSGSSSRTTSSSSSNTDTKTKTTTSGSDDNKRRTRGNTRPSSAKLGLGLSEDSAQAPPLFDESLLANMDELLDKANEYLHSTEFLELLESDSAKKWLSDLQETANLEPVFANMLNTVDLENPQLMVEQAVQGIEQVKARKHEIFALLNNPAVLNSIISEVPPEYTELVQSLLSGDMDKLKEDILAMSGLDDEVKTMVENIFEGKFNLANERIEEAIEEVFDDTTVEQTRQQLLQNPELAETLNIPNDVLRNPMLFSEFFSHSVSSMVSEALGGDSKAKKRSKNAM